jgi:photosystem II stability/assembly factor-like uncharacterized protein
MKFSLSGYINIHKQQTVSGEVFITYFIIEKRSKVMRILCSLFLFLSVPVFAQLDKTLTTNWVSTSNGGLYDAGSNTYLSGRINSIAFHPTDTNTIYIAAAGGGVWKTTNGGTNWSVTTDGLSSISSGDVIVDQKNPNIVYYGTGELNFAWQTCFPGNGLFKSTDGGTTWNQIATAATVGSYCSQLTLDPKNSSILYFAGSAGLLKSTNSGTSWTTINATTNAMNIFPNTCANTGYAVGANGTIIKTTNGGTNWTTQSSGTTYALNGVSFCDANYGFVVGASGKILKTTNGGTIWTQALVGTGTFNAVSMVDTSNCTTVGSGGSIYNTTNGGISWTNQTVASGPNFIGVSMVNASTGFAVGTGGAIYHTTNGGTTWTAQTSGTTNTLFSVSFVDVNNGTAVGVSGTILHTTNGGTNWSAQTSGTTNTLAGVSFSDANNGFAAGYSGTILHTTNGGTTWTSQTQGASSRNYYAVSFTDVNRGAAFASADTVIRTINGCTSWTTQACGVTYQINAGQFVYDNTKILMASFLTGESGSGTIRMSTDGGSTWTTQTSGLPATMGRIQLAPYKQNFNYIYAGIASGSAAGLYETTNMGSTWTLQNSTYASDLSAQGYYDNALVVNPNTSASLIAGGCNIWGSTNSGVTLTNLYSSYDSLHYIHADHHRVAYRGNTLYICCDGGVYRSYNDGSTVKDLNKTLSTLQYYSADYSTITNNNVIGGTQDNATNLTRDDADWKEEAGAGDAGYMLIDQVDTNYVYNASNSNWLARSPSFGVGSTWTKITPDSATVGAWLPPFKIAGSSHLTLMYGSHELWRTDSATTCTHSSGWKKLGTFTPNVSAIGISPTNSNKIYVGDANYVYVTTNNGTNWSSVSLGSLIGINDLFVDGTNDNTCYAALGATTNLVAKTTNSGTSWLIINGDLPAVSNVHAIILRTSPTRRLFIATDAGVYTSTNEGTNWTLLNNGMPTTHISDLKYYVSSNKLLAATHGRGCWTYDCSGLGKDMFSEIPKIFNLAQNYPNPFNPETQIQFDLPSAGLVNLTVYDITGRKVETLVNGRFDAGKFEVTFHGSKYASGVYMYKLTLDNSSSVTKKMMLMK